MVKGDLLAINGINAVTGGYGRPGVSTRELVDLLAKRPATDPRVMRELRSLQSLDSADVQRHPREGVDPKSLEQAGWGVIFAHDIEPAVRDALQPLLEWRREQAGDRFRVFSGDMGFLPGDSKASFLARNRAAPGPVDPEIMPYYLLLVGGPEAISFVFQSQLDVQYAVGRIHFETTAEYACYAESVVRAENEPPRRPRRLSFFGVEHPDDRATRLSSRHLIGPLARYLGETHSDWEVETVSGVEASRANLALRMGRETPALILTASHGMEFPSGHPSQRSHQGALLCQDWPGPKVWDGAIPRDFYFAGEDLEEEADLLGLIGFFFACYGAGTPRLDNLPGEGPRGVAPGDFLAALPTRMLAHPRGGALAVIGHVDRAWSYSFAWPGIPAQTTVFESVLDRLLAGHPVGSAMEHFDLRYAELSTQLTDLLERMEFGGEVDAEELAGLWTSNRDARDYLILGDPAVRLTAMPSEDMASEDMEGTSLSIDDDPMSSFSLSGAAPASAATAAEVTAAEVTAAEAMVVEAAEESLSAVEKSLPTEAGDVRFSAYHPRSLRVGEARPLLVYIHLLEESATIGVDAGQVLGQAAGEFQRSESKPSMAIPLQTEIRVVPRARGLAFDPPEAHLTWLGDWQRADFEMKATGERRGHVIEGSVACFVGPVLIADIRLPVVVPRVAADEAQAPADAENLERRTSEMYKAIFASYSHADTAIVEEVEKVCEALGMDYLRDVMDLRAGQDWSEGLLEMIEKADVFQLFWSRTASESAYVEQEWRHALDLVDEKGPAFIRPIYWQRPLPPVPAALGHIHFAPAAFAESDPEPSISITALNKEFEPLTVTTHGAADPSGKSATRASVRTRISLTGEVETHVDHGSDQDLLKLHQRMVTEAVKLRLAILGKPG